MPFATVERTHKRFRPGDAFDDYGQATDQDEFYSPQSQQQYFSEWPSYLTVDGTANKSQVPGSTPFAFPWLFPDHSHFPSGMSIADSPPSSLEASFTDLSHPQMPGQDASHTSDNHSQAATTPYSQFSSEEKGQWLDDLVTTNVFQTSPQSPSHSLSTYSSSDNLPVTLPANLPANSILSKLRLSRTSMGISMEAHLSSISDFRSLIETFSSLCSTQTSTETTKTTAPTATNANTNTSTDANQKSSTVVLYRNRNCRTKPVNFFATVDLIGQLFRTPSWSELSPSLRFITDTCIDVFFTCWARYGCVMPRDEFMRWYNHHEDPTETLIVNAICARTFRHVVAHHYRPELASFLADQDRIRQQEAFFFNRARSALASSFDQPDRHTIIALLCMCCCAELSRRHHYLGMATSALHELEIYPRMVGDKEDSFEKEFDTRLWWFVWSIDFYVYSSGAPKNTPQPRFHGTVDLPRVMKQDTEAAKFGVLTTVHCLMLWRIQADIVRTLYEQDSDMTVDQRNGYDRQLATFYDALPPYLRLDGGYDHSSKDLFLACIRVNVEYNATRIILHKLFIPEVGDPHPSRFSLESLNTCLATALKQLHALSFCTEGASVHCVFDRNELWRAAEVISMSMDIQRTCDSPLILDKIDPQEYEGALSRAYEILQRTREHELQRKDWIQVADWLHAEIRRHQLYAHNPSRRLSVPTKPITPDGCLLPHLKPPSQDTTKDHKTTTPAGSMLSVLSFAPSPSIPQRSQPSPAKPCNPNDAHTETISSFVHFSPTNQNQSTRPSGQRNQPRFRYFNPGNMSKFLFIDENPTLF